MSIAPLMQRRASEDVAAQLRQLIRSGELPFGTQLPSQRELASTLQVGRSVLREALSELQGQGYVETKRGAQGGSFVVEPVGPADVRLRELRDDLGELDAIVDFRIAVETEAAALAAARRSADDLAAMRAAVDRLHADVDRHRFRAADASFHAALADAAANRRLSDAMRQARAELFVPLDDLDYREGIAATRREHAAILRAVERRSRGAARDAMRAHLEHTRRDLHAVVQRAAR